MKSLFMIGCAMLLSATSAWSQSSCRIAGTPLEKYTIVYPAAADLDEGAVPAAELQGAIKEATGVEVPLKSDAEFRKGASIRVGNPGDMNTFDYSLNMKNGKVTVDGGCNWAIDKAAGILVDRIKATPSVAAGTTKGSVAGEFLFPRPEGVTLRILDDNIWDYSMDTIPAEWKQAGIDCRDAARAPEFAQLVRAYMPDVLVLQEYAPHMDKEFYPLIKKYGYRNACVSEGDAWNHTPVFYNPDSLRLIKVNYNLYTPSRWSNHGSKSFTSAVFKQKSTGKIFAIINTHLWWKSDNNQPGSTNARASQVRLMMAEADIITQKYNCPIFITGDMNCEEASVPMQQFILGGYIPCYKVATAYGNTDNGHHQCADHVVGNRKSNRKGPDRATGAIDHCFITNPGTAEIKVFDCIQDYFTVKLTDHYPNLIDVAL